MAYPPILPSIYPGQTNEYQYTYDLVGEWCGIYLPSVPYYKLKSSIDDTDEVHYEILEQNKEFEDPIYVKALFENKTVVQNQENKGTDHLRSFDVWVSLPSLVSSGLATVTAGKRMSTLLIGNGDRIYYYNYVYEVLNYVDLSQWGMTDYNDLWYKLYVEIVRHDANAGGYDIIPSESA